MRPPIDRILEPLEGVRQHDGYHKALCPSHPDENPSLSIREGQDGQVLLKCHAGCDKEDVLTALGLQWKDLYPANSTGSARKPRRKITATYDYVDEGGDLLFQTVRYSPKDFSQRRPDGAGGWISKGVFENGLRPVLYRLPDVLEAAKSGGTVYICEGEKDADLLRDAGLTATTCAMGAGKWRDAYSETLRGAHAVILPHNDVPGRDHAGQIARGLRGKAASVKVLELPGLPEHGDVTDWLGSGHTAGELERLAREVPESQPEGPKEGEVAGLVGRVPLALLLRDGIEPTPQQVEDLIYVALMHSIAGPPGSGKTLLALWLAVQVMRAGGRVLYLDAENGPRLVAERLRDLGADEDTLDELFFYFPADLTLDPEDLSRLAATVKEVRPALAVFDSFADFIAAAGLEENSNTDCTRWVSKVAQPLKDAGTTVLILDHIPKNSKGPRGAGAKVAKMDVVWNVETTLEFDRERTGEITLRASKDRECWLPKIVRFSVGGGVFARSAGTLEERGGDGLTDKQRETLEYLEERGEVGASWGELLDDLGGSKGTLSSTLKKLAQLNLISKRNSRYYVRVTTEPTNATDKPNTTGSVEFNSGSVEEAEPGTSGEVQSGSALPIGSRPTEPGAQNLDERAIAEELRRAGSGPARALANYLKDPDSRERLRYLTTAVLVARNMDTADWERHAPTVERAARDHRNHPLDCERMECL